MTWRGILTINILSMEGNTIAYFVAPAGGWVNVVFAIGSAVAIVKALTMVSEAPV